MSLHLSQQLRQSQRLVMTPQMQQSIALLQMNALELEQHLESELLENPFLEISANGEEEDQLNGSEQGDGEAPPEAAEGTREEERQTEAESAAPSDSENNGTGDDALEESGLQRDLDALGTPENTTEPEPKVEQTAEPDIDFDALFDDTEPRLNTSSFEAFEEENDFTTYTAIQESAADFLERQLALSALSEAEQEVGRYIIGLLDDDGYLHTPVDEIAEEFGLEACDVEDILAVIQTFDPTGIAARSLPECLSLQMDERGIKDRDYYKVVNNHFKLLQQKKFKEVAKAVGITETKVGEIFHFVIKLDPHPGRRLTPHEARYIKPDVYVKEVDGEYMYYVNEGKSGALRINKFYRDILKSKNGGGFKGPEREFAMSKFKNAVWLIKNIEKRKGTVLRVTEAIMQYQREFLEKGVEHLRPLTLKEIAAMVDMHESTIARVTTGKYVETPRGTFELKYFFSSGLETESGEDASSRSIKEKIRQIIGDEDSKRPLSDQKIANILQDDGLRIARRTVAKYREQMKFLPAKLRKAV